MIRYHFDLYPRSNPKLGARLVRFTKLQSAEYRGEANGTGSGTFSIRADDSEAQFIDPAGLQYVRVVREDTVAVTEAVVGGFFLDSGDFSALDSLGTRLLKFGGAGTLSYLARSVMAPHTYLDTAIGSDPFDDTWRLYAQGPIAGGDMLGAVLWRVVYEAKKVRVALTQHRHKDGVIYTDSHADDRTASAIPDLVLGFDAFDDSDSVAWDQTSGEFKAQTNENVLAVVQRLMQAGLYVEMDPDTFELRAWQADDHRRTRTGTTWGPTVVYFTRPTGDDIDTANIKSDAKRRIAAFVKRSLLWVGGQDVYSKTIGTTDIPWEGGYYSDVADTTALSQIGSVQIGARDDAGDVSDIRGRLGTATSSGYYRPFEDAKLDDLVTVKTGTGSMDLNNENFPIAAIRISLRIGGDWDVWYELGSSFSASQSRQFQVTTAPAHSHPPNPPLCASSDLLRGITELKASGAQVTPPAPKTNANDGDDSTTWGSGEGEPSIGVAGEWWAADLGASESIGLYRILQNGGGVPSIQNVATEVRIYATDDAAAWAALPASGKISSDPSGWNLVATRTNALAYNDSGYVAFGPSGGRYVLFRAVTGGTLDWDVETFELWSHAGTSNFAARCDHTHPEAGVTDHGELTGLADDDHPQYLTDTGGEKHTLNTVAASGATETLDLATGNLHDVTLTANCTFTFAGSTAGVGCYLTLILRQDGTGSRTVTWPAAVEWPGGVAPTLSTGANDVDILSFLSDDGGTTWFGLMAGSSGSTSGYHYEVLMTGASPAEPLEDGSGTDWLYVLVAD